MEPHLKISGYLLIALALFHSVFPKRFNWKSELVSLSLMNRQMMYIHTLFIAIVVLLMGVLCVTSSKELTETDLGRKIALGFFFFWFIRLIIQFIGYSPKLWRGKSFETIVHILFSFLWIYLSAVFFLTYWQNKGI